MRLHSITLQNFRNFKDVTFDLNGQDASFFGDNETGKTTVANAYSYLLTDKPYTGEPGFTPKTIKGDEPVHNLNHIVSAQFVTGDGQEIKLTKDYHEIWTKKRGSTAAEMTGHTIDYYVDEVPVKAGEFQDLIKQYFGDPESIQILSVPTYFSDSLTWQKRRELLLSICGDVSDQDVIDAYPELSELPAHLAKGTSGQYTIDELKAKTEASRRKLNQDLSMIPARIDEASKAIPNVFGDRKNLDKDLKGDQKRLAELTALKNASKSEDAQKTQLIIAKQDLQRRIESAKYEYQNAVKKDLRKFEDAVEECNMDVLNARKYLTQLKEDYGLQTKALDRLLKGRQEIMEQLKQEHEKQYHGDTVCPTCSQNLPHGQIESAIAKFNEAKAKRLEELNEKGRTEYHKNIVKTVEDDITELKKKIETTEKELVACMNAHDKAKVAADNAKANCKAWEDTEEGEQYRKELEVVLAAYEEITDDASDISPYDNEISEIEIKIADTQKLISQLTTKEAQEKRIAELEEQEKLLASSVDQADHILHLCETFTRKKADLLSDSINNQFESVRFRLFKDQINGGLKDDCEVLVASEAGNLVPYTSANNAGRINAGIEIINAISKAWGASLPIIIDNAESVTRFKPSESQLIKLVVSVADPELRLEIN